MQNRYKGITLVELVLYLALFSLVILVMVQFFVFVSNKNVDARNRLEISRTIIFLKEHFSQTERELLTVDGGSSVLNNDVGKLVITTSDGNRYYELRDGSIYFNNGADILLTPQGVIVSKLRFEPKVDDLNNIIAVNVILTITHMNVVNYVENIEFLIQPK